MNAGTALILYGAYVVLLMIGLLSYVKDRWYFPKVETDPTLDSIPWIDRQGVTHYPESFEDDEVAS